MTPKLNASIIEAQTAMDALVSVMAELQRAQAIGNVSRIGNASFDGQALAEQIARALSTTFDRASALEVAAYQPAPAEPFLQSSERISA